MIVKKLIIAIFLFFIFFSGFIYGRRSLKSDCKNLLNPDYKEVREGGFRFINPILECVYNEEGFVELKSFQSDIEEFVRKAKQKNEVDFMAVYFRDLNNGPWFGINEKDVFSPASLLKLPVIMAYYKMEEVNPGVLNQVYLFEKVQSKQDWSPKISPSISLELGKSYSVSDLIYRSLVYSDNEAHYLLMDHVNTSELKNIFLFFGFSWPTEPSDDVLINVKNYSGLFRILFNASYLNKQNSEKVLEIISNSDYKEGLRKGVPETLLVSHKFGERTLKDTQQLHDCGIIYYPKSPYLLCILTKGKDINSLSKIISEMSSLVYVRVNTNKQ